jgi:hypothetical protein
MHRVLVVVQCADSMLAAKAAAAVVFLEMNMVVVLCQQHCSDCYQRCLAHEWGIFLLLKAS